MVLGCGPFAPWDTVNPTGAAFYFVFASIIKDGPSKHHLAQVVHHLHQWYSRETQKEPHQPTDIRNKIYSAKKLSTLMLSNSRGFEEHIDLEIYISCTYLLLHVLGGFCCIILLLVIFSTYKVLWQYCRWCMSLSSCCYLVSSWLSQHQVWQRKLHHCSWSRNIPISKATF